MRVKSVMLLLMLAVAGTTAAENRNFLFLLVDDLGYGDLGYTGSAFYETPNIDALAASGMRFEQGYAACQVCNKGKGIHGRYRC